MQFNLEWFNQNKRLLGWVTVATVGVVGLALAAVYRERWLPAFMPSVNASTDEEEDDHSGHNHAGHDESNSLELSPEAKKNIGLTTTQVELGPFERQISVPAMVVERPGRSQIEVTAPMGGRVTRIYPIEGDAVLPGQPLFDIRLTHEDLVTAQSEFLRTSKELQVIQREIDRLNSVTVSGAIAGKTVRGRVYEQEKLQAAFSSQEQSLLLHGLSKEQIKGILDDGELLAGVTVVAPEHPEHDHAHEDEHPFHVQSLSVKPGQYVEAGGRLSVLADHFELYIEGRAFEEDAKRLTLAANEQWELSAVTAFGGRDRDIVSGLTIDYLSDTVESDSRAFHFYVMLPNRIVRDVKILPDGKVTHDENLVRDVNVEGHRVVTWKFKPGQRMDIRVPVEKWEGQIVLPVDAVVDEGAEAFVFEQNGDHFDRVPVHVEYRGQDSVVIENNGKLIGATVAASGAYQMQLALKNKSGGAVDPHAGHNH